jgi:N-acetylneuraminic acid mutarotase
VPIQGTEGVTAGLILGEMLANAVEPDVYTAQIFVTDATSLRSNTLSGSARISAFPWTAKLAGPTLREYAASAVLNGKLYVMGGQLTNSGTTPGPATNLVEVYDPATNTWATATPMPTARMGLVAAVMNGKIYAIGGRTDGYSTSAVGTVTEFDPATNLWVTKTATLPTARYFAAASVVDSPLGTRIFVVGGEALDARLGVVEAYEPDDTGPGNWISRTAMPTARGQLAMAQANGRLYAVGGYAGMVSQWVGTVEEYNPLLDTWATRAPMPTARAHLALAQVDGNLLAAGGENVDRALAVLERYDPLTNLWSVKTPNTTVFSRTTAGVMNGKVYMFGNGLTLEYNPANEIR